ncbi:MAG: PAS domain S-box protein, partial [Halobacteria archaeon]|nr:PAS domain S-box protein [Halobacteria archaeon]
MSHDYRLLYVGGEFPWAMGNGHLEVTCVSTLPEALERLRLSDGNGYDCLVADYSYFEDNTDELSDAPVVVLAADEDGYEAVERGADDYLPPDAPARVFENRIRNVVSHSSEDELEKYRTLVETVADGMYLLDEDGYIRTVNDALLELHGREREELVGAHVSEFMRDEDVETGRQLILELLAGEGDEPWGTYEIELETADGETRTNEIKLAVVTDDEGEYAGSVGVMRDIEERK